MPHPPAPAQPRKPVSYALTLEAFNAALPARGTLFGLDLGTKTVGVALSDVTRTIASPFDTVRRVKFSADVKELLSWAAKHGVVGLVLGLPVNLDGQEGPRAQATRAFARNLAPLTALPLMLWDERLSTQEAERVLLDADQSRRRRAEVIDKMAAAYILQGALDRLKNASPG
jgi:putative Holliday junction resolvase